MALTVTGRPVKPEWVFAIDTGDKRFRAAIVSDAAGFCSVLSTHGTAAWHADDSLNPADLICPEYELYDWEIEDIDPPDDLIEFLRRP